MAEVLVKDRLFTYTRLSLQHGEVQEHKVAHFVVASTFKESMVLSFYNISTNGQVYMVHSVVNVLEHDNGIIVTEDQ